MEKTTKIIEHQFKYEPFYIPDWPISHLLIGTFNPSGGEPVNYYYGRKRNQTWKLISRLFGDEFDPSNKEEFFRCLVKHKIGCVDMIDSLESSVEKLDGILGKGYKDSNIINAHIRRMYNTEKILRLIDRNKGLHVYSTWGIGPSFQEWKHEIKKIGKVVTLVSPSFAARVPKGTDKFENMLADWNSKIKKEECQKKYDHEKQS